MIPKKTSPLTKAIRTTEGILVTIVNIAVGVAAAIPSTHLSTREAAIIASINTGALVAQRAVIKGVALLSAGGLPPSEPLLPSWLSSPNAEGVAGQAIGDVLTDVNKKPSILGAEEQAAALIPGPTGAQIDPTSDSQLEGPTTVQTVTPVVAAATEEPSPVTEAPPAA